MSTAARGLALAALALAAGVIAGVVIASHSGQTRRAQSSATVLRTVTVTRRTRPNLMSCRPQPSAAGTAPPTSGARGTFVPLDVQRFGFATEIPAHWRVRTHTYGQRHRVTLTNPGGQMIVIDRTPRAPCPAQINHGFRTVSLTRWRGIVLSGILWRFAAPFCAPVCSDWIGASPHAGYAVLIYTADPALVREATVVAARLHDHR